MIRNGFCSCHVFANSLTTLGVNLLMFTARNNFCWYNYNLLAAIKKSKRNTLSFREPAFLLVSYPECSFSIVSRLGKLSVDQEINLYDRRPMNSVKRPPKRKAGSEDKITCKLLERGPTLSKYAYIVLKRNRRKNIFQNKKKITGTSWLFL